MSRRSRTSAAASGGTLTTAIFQLGKRRGGAKPDFDPLLKRPDGSKSESLTKITNPKQDVYCDEFAQYGGPVMANCVRRSNAPSPRRPLSDCCGLVP